MNFRTSRGSSRRARAQAGSAIDKFRFFTAWSRNPGRVAAIAPSGRALALLITREVGPETGPVLELGPGTGVFTQALIDRGVAAHDLTLVEYDAQFARLLSLRFPQAKVVRMDATELADRFPAQPAPFGAVICGLGLMNMRAERMEALLRGAFALMAPDAAFYLFTYGRRCSVPSKILDRIGLKAERVGTVLRNLPPASVYRIVRRTADDC